MAHTTFHTINPETTLTVVSSGPSQGEGPTLVFLHFWGGSSRTFSGVIEHLPAHHSVAINFRGWGDSTGPQIADAYSIKSLASDVEAVIAELGIKDFILIGHSMGGKVAQLVAGRGVVEGLKGLVLIAPAPSTPLVLPEEMREQQISAYNNAGAAEFVTQNVLTASKLSDEIVSITVQDMLKGNPFAKKAWPEYGMSEDVANEAKNIKVPTLVIAGGLDKVETVERVKAEVVQRIHHAVMVVLEGKGHLLPLETPAEVAGHVEGFVREVSSSK